MTTAIWPYLISSIIITFPLRILGVSLGTLFLRGLNIFLLPEEDTPLPNSQLAQLSRKQQKKLDKSKTQTVSMGGPENLMMFSTAPSYLESLPSFTQLDNAFLFLLMFVANAVAGYVGETYLEMPSNPLLQPLSVAIICALMAGLLEAELFSKWTLPSEKVGICVTGAASTLASLLLILLGPKYVIDFKVEEASEQLGQVLTSFLKKVGPEDAEEREPVTVEPLLVTVMLALAAGVLSGMLMTSAMRYAKLLLLACHPPAWDQQYFKTSAVSRTLLSVSLLLPCASAVLAVKPLAAVLGISEATAGVLRPLLLLASGAMHLIVFRKLMQSFFLTALVEWWSSRHGGAGKGGVLAAQRIRARNVFINFVLTGKVALQMLAPASVFIALGSVHMLQVLPGMEAGSLSTFVTSCSGYLGWWVSSWWFVISSLTVTFHRLGFMEVSGR